MYLIDVIFLLKNEFSFFMYILRCFPDISSFSLNVFTLILVIYIVHLCSLNFSNFNCLQCFLWINAAYVGVLKSFCSFIRDCQIGNFTLNQIYFSYFTKTKMLSMVGAKPKYLYRQKHHTVQRWHLDFASKHGYWQSQNFGISVVFLCILVKLPRFKQNYQKQIRFLLQIH